MAKMKQIQEAITLKTGLKKSEWHTCNYCLENEWTSFSEESNKGTSCDEASAAIVLPEYLSEMQTKNQRLISQIEEEEKGLSDHNSDLRYHSFME